MGFSYQVMSEQEAMEARYQLLKEGIYEAVISTSIDKTSSTGNPMMDMTVSVYDENGKAHDIRDFLVFTEKMTWKAIHCAESAGILQEFQEGKFCSELVQNKRVKVKIAIEKGGIIPEDKLKGSPLGSRYPDKNKIEDYLKDCEQASKESNELVDSEIPF
jgi:hypothetical protein